MLPDGVRLIHVRHGQTDWNVAGRLQGQLDIPINAVGQGQANENGRRLKAWLDGEGIAPDHFAFVSSPLGRSRETMNRIRDELGLGGAWATDDRLKEVSFGEWAGFTYQELREDGREALVRARKKDKWSFRPPGGETYAELAERVGAWLETLERDTIAVTHGGVHRVLFGHLCGTPWHEVPSLPVPQDKVFVFEGDGAVRTV
ncbi:histidine phosphatase family protein [Acuticoccus sp. I52.16.1]|uniref:histidine phosphatase family protein n=1 Tax=Acuticoccus sp. I52.16.1 TaxID=2928472 RepID=UPI001FD10536|nr:histidine phosphatase family protein [Acuticoccus sp. I52.16.1]UOM33042.1 histidine phosphatase family protein [Acuticoccus sp. I52.16.1]